MARKEDTISEFTQLKADLREKCTRNLYFFYGDEVFLLHHYFNQLKKLLIDELTEEFNFHKFTNENFSVQDFAWAVENLPMMSEHTMIHVDDIDLFKLSENDREHMGEILSDIPDYCTVVFTYETVAWKPDKRYKKLWTAMSENGSVVEFEKQSQRDLIAWLTRHFAARQKRISPDLCAYLIDITDGTMTTLAGEVAKICAYSGDETIKRYDIDAVTEPTLDAVVFQMTDYLGQGEYAQALTKLQQLFKLQQESIAILGAVGMHFRRLSAARILLDNGRGAGELAKMYPMTDFAARKMMDSARRFSAQFCEKAVGLVVETDEKMKTSFDDPERLLELLILQLAQEARNG